MFIHIPTKLKIQSHSDIVTPLFSDHESLWTDIPCYWFTATHDIAPYVAANKQWRSIGIWLELFEKQRNSK
jgi:hypothetical protein